LLPTGLFAEKQERLESGLETQHLRRHDCLIIDEIGYLPFGREEANLSFQCHRKTHNEHWQLLSFTSNPIAHKWA